LANDYTILIVLLQPLIINKQQPFGV